MRDTLENSTCDSFATFDIIFREEYLNISLFNTVKRVNRIT